MNEVHMLTGNAVKFEIAQNIFSHHGITVHQLNLDIPEIQSLSVEDVAAHSARLAAREKQVPVFKTDVGFYFAALNGFPGPFMKFALETLLVDDWLHLMIGKTDRRVVIRECICFAFPDGRTQSFVDETSATVVDQAAGEGFTSIDHILVLDGWDKTIASYSREEQFARWCAEQTIYTKLAQFIQGVQK